jgi:hypothetical protein
MTAAIKAATNKTKNAQKSIPIKHACMFPPPQVATHVEATRHD